MNFPARRFIRLRQPARLCPSRARAGQGARPGNTPWLATGMNGKANLGEVRQMTDEDGLAQASAEFRLACATDAPRLVAGSFIFHPFVFQSDDN